MNFFETVYEIVRSIPYGHVMSYGQVARLAALHGCRPEDHVPWHRVVKKDGQIAERFLLGSDEIQRDLLFSEGITFDEKGRVEKEYFV